MEHFPQVPGSIRLDSDALGRMHPQPSQKASDRQRQQAISQGLSSTAISRGLIEACRRSGPCALRRCHPRRSAVASLKLR